MQRRGGQDADAIPYAERPDWKDVDPVKQNDGEEPLVVINYPPGFEEVHSYFRAVQQKGEFSERALELTSDVIRHNSANYTAWYYRRRCLTNLKSDLEAEHRFTDQWARDCPKNYQVWFHRRWLISEMAKAIEEKASEEEAKLKISELAERELEFHQDTMQVNDDFKNYNGWSHRQFILQKFGQWSKELEFVEDLLRDDIRNNSAWNHRYTVVRNTTWPITDEVRRRELDFTIKSIRSCASNESAWNYLGAFLGDGDGKVSWSSSPEVEALCKEVIEAASAEGETCRFAVHTLANVYEARGQVGEALQQYDTLKGLDSIRARYWEWRAAYLLKKTEKS